MKSLLFGVVRSRRSGVVGSGSPATPPGPSTVLSFTQDATTDFPNPERGWYVEGGTFGATTAAAPVGGSGNPFGTNPVRLHLRYVRLDDYRTTATLPTAFIDALAAELAGWRSSGAKGILAFAYNRSDCCSATLTTTLGHIAQLGPTITAYQDVIALVQTRMVGPYGEQYYWANDPTAIWWETQADRHAFIQAWLDNTPSTMMLQVRYARHGLRFMDTEYINTVLPEADRFTGSDQARLGLWCDSIAANSTWGDTFGSYSGYTLAEEEAWGEGQSAYTVFGGETSDIGGLNADNDGSTVLARFADMHLDYLNSEFWTSMFTKWNSSGHLGEISRRLGYRLHLVSVEVPTSITASSAQSISLTMSNTGFGKVYNKRPIDLVFVGSGGPFTVRLTDDARVDLPLGGESNKTMTYNFTAPAGLVSGQNYALHIRLPDPSSNLDDNNDYAIRLANTGIWDGATGRHSLGFSVTVP